MVTIEQSTPSPDEDKHAVSSRNVTIYISCDNIVRQTIKQFIVTYHHEEQ